jgi:hypothetical protein
MTSPRSFDGRFLVPHYRFTIQGEITAENAADAYEAVSELLTRVAEARRSGAALLRFDLADKIRVTLEPLDRQANSSA